MKITETHTITVDSDKATEKSYTIDITYDLSQLNDSDMRTYALDAITVKTVNPMRKKGHAFLAGLNGVYEVLVPRPGTRQTADPEKAARNLSIDVLEKILAEKEAERKAKTILRPGPRPGHEQK